MRQRPLTLATSALILAISSSARGLPAENLLANGGFETGLSGWSRTVDVSWSPLGGGAARIQQHDDVGGSDVMIQCVPVEGGRLYDLAASAYLPDLAPWSGGVSVGVRWYPLGNCQGTTLGGTRTLDFSAVVPADWQREELRIAPAPFASASALVYVVVRADAPDSYIVLVDDLSLTRSPETEVLTLPTAATITGALGQRFQTDLVLYNPAPAERMATFKLYPAGATHGPLTPVVLRIGPRQARDLTDVMHEVFGSPDRAGAIEVEYDPRGGPMQAFARAGTINADNPGNSMTIPVLPRVGARASARYLGIAPGNRVNAGAFNPTDAPVDVTFTVRDALGNELGHVTRTWGAYEWFQVNGLANEVSTGGPAAWVDFTAQRPVFPFVIAIDNRSGDPAFLPALDLVELP
jgi:hypothetical protein